MSSALPFLTANDVGLVHDLLSRHVSQWKPLPIRCVGQGWDTIIFDVGDGLVARFPVRAQSVDTIMREQQWLGYIASVIATNTPQVVHTCPPDDTFPYPWLVTRWVDGDLALGCSPDLRDRAARALALAVASLHREAPRDAPTNPFRGVTLGVRLERLSDDVNCPEMLPYSEKLLHAVADAPPYGGALVWCHGDLHPGNYLVDEQGDLAGVIDFGDLTRGDPAVDCATAWLSFTSAGRAIFFEAYCQARGLDDDARVSLISRSRGWAVAAFIAPLLTSPLASEQYRALGRYGLSQVLLDDSLT